METLDLFAIGSISPGLLAGVAARVSRSVSLACRVVPPPAAFAPALLEGRAHQIDADRLLRDVEARATGEAYLAALVAADMANPLFTHFFGRARLGGRALVVSVARLRPEFHGAPGGGDVTERRAAVEVAHELGHLGGLRHCGDPGCLMHLAHTVDAIDTRGPAPCAGCRERIARSASPFRPRFASPS
jgi:archaemetzincin